MGCHTWAYVHIPSEADKWVRDYKDAFIKEMKKLPTSYLLWNNGRGYKVRERVV